MPVWTVKVSKTLYRFEGITKEEADILRREVLTDPVTQSSTLNPKLSKLREVGYKPGVTDPVEISLFRAASLLGIAPKAVSSSELTKREPSQIERVIAKEPKTLLFSSKAQSVRKIAVSRLNDSELENLSRNRSLFLNLEEMQVIQKHYKKLNREPTDLELEVFAQTWSEHCCHKTFKAKLIDEKGKEYDPLMTRLKRSSKKFFKKVRVVSAFSDNAGGMDFYGGKVIIGKGETHNSPVAIDPYAGSLTKNGGVYRDIVGFGKGGENLLSFMVNNFADPNTPDFEIPNGVLPPRYLLLENSRGERDYGNPMGIPTHGIVLHFHPDFAPKPTSLGVVIGITDGEFVHKELPCQGDLIVSMGGKTGRDGIHGATFSSAEMTENTINSHSTAVQLGDPIVEKAMFDAIIEARDGGLIRSITDCGAGGYSSAIGEMAKGVGAEVNLEKVPTKYEGLAPWELFLSESQERMILAVSPDNLDALLQIAEKHDTRADVIGKFTGKNNLVVKHKNKLCGDIDLDFLHGGLPQRVMKMKSVKYGRIEMNRQYSDYGKELKSKLSDLNICSKEEMHRMYDMTVQAKTVMAPWVGVNQNIPSDASVVAPVAGKPYGIVSTCACNPLLNAIDPHKGTKWAFRYAAAKFAAAGGDIFKACGIDNYIWPFPDEESLFGLHKATEGLCEMIEELGIPMVSGKDSLSSTYRDKNGEVIKAPPTLNITIFGKIKDIEHTVTPDFKFKTSTICLLTDKNLLKTFKKLNKAIQAGQIFSAKAIGEGGLAVALTQMCIGGNCGAEIEVEPDEVFSEIAGAIIIEVASKKITTKIFKDIRYKVLGKTKSKKRLVISDLLDEDICELRDIWNKPMEKIIRDA